MMDRTARAVETKRISLQAWHHHIPALFDIRFRYFARAGHGKTCLVGRQF